MNETVYWIWLSLCCTPDTSTFPKLLERFSDAREVYDATDREISDCVGRNSSDRSALINKDLERAVSIYDFCKKRGVGILPYSSEKYPTSLRNIKTPPVLLYYRGTLPDFDKLFMISVVGTRSLSDYGRRYAFKIAYDLASVGAIVVSGMAMGIDGVALAGALSAGGRTVAVLGSGIDVCYPQGHLTLAREIVKGGCIMTEYAPGTSPNKFNFPKRNRIISGLCAATLVIEGRERSGALITARCAKEQGRALYAMPGNIGSPNSEVSNLLIKNGASLCTCAEDIIGDFESKYPGALNPFNLSQRLNVDMMQELSRLSVISVCQSDDIFTPPRPKKKTQKGAVQSIPVEPVEVLDDPTPTDPPESFDSRALKIYKRIPLIGECSIESLVDEQISLRDVMKLLLKLEMGNFITMLPGESVQRKGK